MGSKSIRVANVSKEYRLGTIGRGTLKGDLQSWWARVRHKEDPNLKIGVDQSQIKGNERFLALNDVSFEVEQGDTLGILGHNGAGKSTLLKLLSRVTAPTTGCIGINGRIASMLEVGTGFHPELTGRENIYMNGAILGMTKAEITRKFDEIVEFAELAKFIDTPVKRYSSGMYVKLAFAVAAHLDSEIMVMDEVLAVGDMKFQDKCLGKMGDVSSKEGRTVLYVSHNMNTIRRLCKRCIVLDHGRKIYDGDTNGAIEIYSSEETTFRPIHEFKRASYWDYYIRNIQMLSCEQKNTTNGIYDRGDKIEVELKCHSDIDADDIRLRVEYFNGAESLVGVTCTKPLSPFRKGKNKTVNFFLDTSFFSRGKYIIFLALYRANAEGNSTTIDLGRYAMRFSINEVNDADNIIGDVRIGGFVRLPLLSTKCVD